MNFQKVPVITQKIGPLRYDPSSEGAAGLSLNIRVFTERWIYELRK